MKYMALIYVAPENEPAPGTAEFDTMMADYAKVTDVFIRDGVMVGGEALEPVETATSLRVRAGKCETMDGPFAETREHLGGYYIFECDNLDQAMKYAAMIPAAQHGTIEVRPILAIS